MIPDPPLYIWQEADWPRWRYDLAALAAPLAQVSHSQGLLLGRLRDVGMDSRAAASLAALTDDVLKTSAIEGEVLAPASVRSSLARRLGVEIGALAPADRHVEGVVDMVLDATGNCQQALSAQRLHSWHLALFPAGYSGLSAITVGAWRSDAQGAMQVVSGSGRRQKVHYQAPPAAQISAQIDAFLAWFNAPSDESPLLRAGVAHFWFLTLHPFDDGNGRIARAVGDMLLARADGSGQRFYSLSAQIQRDRSAYYAILERCQKGSLDITAWLQWFLAALLRALEHAHAQLDQTLLAARFWQHWGALPMNARQTKVLRLLLADFEGKLSSSKWAALCKCSPDTALRDIKELLAHGVLRPSAASGRSTSYELNLTAFSGV
mgnify:CR=1 FL=1